MFSDISFTFYSFLLSDFPEVVLTTDGFLESTAWTENPTTPFVLSCTDYNLGECGGGGDELMLFAATSVGVSRLITLDFVT